MPHGCEARPSNADDQSGPCGPRPAPTSSTGSRLILPSFLTPSTQSFDPHLKRRTPKQQLTTIHYQLQPFSFRKACRATHRLSPNRSFRSSNRLPCSRLSSGLAVAWPPNTSRRARYSFLLPWCVNRHKIFSSCFGGTASRSPAVVNPLPSVSPFSRRTPPLSKPQSLLGSSSSRFSHCPHSPSWSSQSRPSSLSATPRLRPASTSPWEPTSGSSSRSWARRMTWRRSRATFGWLA